MNAKFRYSKKAMTLVAVGAAALLSLAACEKNVVDGKATLEVPAVDGNQKSLCYLIEVDRGETEESYYCVSRNEFNRNTVGEEWVDANGKKK